MGYISNRGVLSGPIQLNGVRESDNNKVWITPITKTNMGFGIHFSDAANTPATSSGHYFPIFTATPAYTAENWESISHAAATMQWVNDNFISNGSGDVPGFDPTKYVKVEDFNFLESTVDSNIQRIKTLEETVLQIDPLKNRITILENNFNSYKNNPYPDGVIFVAGTAAEVV